MARNRKPARVVNWKGKPHLFYTDYSIFPPAQRRASCEALQAVTADARAALVKKYRALELKGQYGAAFGEPVPTTAYDITLAASLDDYQKEIAGRVEARQAAGGARIGLAGNSGARIRDSLRLMRYWLAQRGHEGLVCGDVTTRHLDDFKLWLATNNPDRSPHTINLDLRNIKGAIRWVERLRPVRFRDAEILVHALKSIHAEPPAPVAYTPDQLAKFLQAATTNSPRVVPVFRFLALTGCRRGEALALTWADVDLDRGRITFRAQKTGRTRILPLIGAPEGDIAPGLLAELRARAGKPAEHVFSHFPEKAWENTAALAGVPVMPQGLRSSFTSYAASLGIPASVCALWQGHGLQVAERYYRAQILERKKSVTIAGAMGLE